MKHWNTLLAASLVLSALASGCGSPCIEGELKESVCGINARGTLVEVCQDSAWVSEGICSDPDECFDGAEQDVACGLNGRGAQAQRCDGGAWESIGECLDPDECTDGSEALVAACGSSDLAGRKDHCVQGSWDQGECKALSLSSGFNHTCAVRANGGVICWGANAKGQLGHGDDEVESSNIPVRVKGLDEAALLEDAVSVSAGNQFTCAVQSNGRVACWGSNENGELGDGNGGADEISSVPVQVIGLESEDFLEEVTAVTAGSGFACALLANTKVACWGAGGSGRLGHGSEDSSPHPVLVRGVTGEGDLEHIVDVSAGPAHACAVAQSGTTFCWGSNAQGQLGNNGGGAPSSIPVQALVEPSPGGGGALEVSSGTTLGATCIRRNDGRVYCWGPGSSGQLGNGSDSNSPTPVAVQRVDGTGDGALTPITGISAGSGSTCAYSSVNATYYCWGSDSYGQLGRGTAASANTIVETRPVIVSNFSQPGIISSGGALPALDGFSCVVVNNGNAYCWGFGTEGRLGRGSNTSSGVPVAVVWPQE